MGALTKINGGIDRLKWKFGHKRMQEKRTAEVVARLQQYPETQFLLQLANQEGVGVHFDPRLRNTDVVGTFVSDRDTKKQYIVLSPSADIDALTYRLIHELRHLWQDKVLGITPDIRNLTEPNAETALMQMRVREADAHAFSNLMLRRMHAAEQDIQEGNRLLKKLTGEGQQPDAKHVELVNKFLADKMVKRFPDEHQSMVTDFVWTLRNLDTYDRRALVEYHARYTSPSQNPQPHPDEKKAPHFGLDEIRGIMKMGVGDTMPGYLEAVPNDEFKQALLQDVSPKLLQTVKLMDQFEKAARKGISEQDSLQARANIESKLRDAVQEPPRAITKSQYTPVK
jgi:hypothetical protein